jgi:sugar phosphate isomerase/epimerase
MVESFRKDFTSSVRQAAAIGASGVQAYANSEMINADMSARDISEVRKIIEGEGLEFSALCGDFGCKMFYLPEECRELIDREKRVLEIAAELGTKIVTTHIGVVPDDKNCRQYENMHKVCYELAHFADSIGGRFAVETGPEKAAVLKDFLDSLQSRGVSVNLDPANLVMCAGDNPVEAVYILKDYIVHTHAKDGIQLMPFDTRRLYAPSYFGLEPGCHDCFKEVPLGEGGVDWPGYIKALKDIGYDGYLTIERECGDRPEEDILKAINFLKEII